MCSVRISSILRSRTSIFIYLITMSPKKIKIIYHYIEIFKFWREIKCEFQIFCSSSSQKLIVRYLRRPFLLTWFDLFHKDSQTATDSSWWLGVNMFLLGPFYTKLLRFHEKFLELSRPNPAVKHAYLLTLCYVPYVPQWGENKKCWAIFIFTKVS